MRQQLSAITIRGFKTIQELVDFQPGPLTVLIGPNGAGKSNFISFFRMLSWGLAAAGNLQLHISELGGGSALLFEGPGVTREIEARLTFRGEDGNNEYWFRLFHAAGDTLIFADERFRFSRHGTPGSAAWIGLDAGHREARLIGEGERRGGAAKNRTAAFILSLLRRMHVYQFHNTSKSARMRGKWLVEDGRWLKEDAANLAPFLFRLREQKTPYYLRIVETLRQLLPFFGDFEFEPEHDRLLLAWSERGSDVIFNASQAADGMLRIMALVALLLQPDEDLPEVLILDEPELGLHPYAIEAIAGFLRAASKHVQVMVATQSVSLIDRFAAEDVVVVERKNRESSYRRLNPEDLREWLNEYSLSELWEKNVIGGRP